MTARPVLRPQPGSRAGVSGVDRAGGVQSATLNIARRRPASCRRRGRGRAEGIGSAAAVDERGYFYTRGRARLDAEGYLFIEGRVDDTIIRGAENIAPAEIEDVLMRHPDIADAAVVGVPDEEWGQRIDAVVVARDGAEVDDQALREHVRAALRGSKTSGAGSCGGPVLAASRPDEVEREDGDELAPDQVERHKPGAPAAGRHERDGDERGRPGNEHRV